MPDNKNPLAKTTFLEGKYEDGPFRTESPWATEHRQGENVPGNALMQIRKQIRSANMDSLETDHIVPIAQNFIEILDPPLRVLSHEELCQNLGVPMCDKTPKNITIDDHEDVLPNA